MAIDVSAHLFEWNVADSPSSSLTRLVQYPSMILVIYRFFSLAPISALFIPVEMEDESRRDSALIEIQSENRLFATLNTQEQQR